MIRIAATALTVVLVLAAGRPAQAQTPLANPEPVQPSVGVMGYAPALRPGGTSLTNREEPGLLRRALPDGDMRDWIAEDDPSVALLRSGTAPSRAALLFDIGSDGRVTGCRVERGEPDAYSTGLCERMSQRMKLLPALDLAGNRVPDAYFIYVWFERQTRPGTTRLVDYKQLPPSPPPPLPPGGWPLDWASTDTAVTGLDLLEGGGGAPAAFSAPWTGVRVGAEPNGALTCSVVGSSGDTRFDRRACDAARRGRYPFPTTARDYERRTWVHFVQEAGRPRAILAEHERPARARATAQSIEAIRAAAPAGSGPGLDAVRVRLEVDVAGTVTQCLVTTSAGSDDIDIAACTLTRRLGRFEPAEDVFGRPRASALYDWSPTPFSGS
jgi:hypothetical protein